ncbi:MAG: hypothetical protein U0457_08300 [Candidatus Sericytochromatia bacterium]
MKKILLVLFIIFISLNSCTLLFLTPFYCDTTPFYKIELGKPFVGRVINLILNDNDNGAIVFTNEILKIKNLEVTEKVCLKDEEPDADIGINLYSSDKNNDGLLAYFRENYYREIYPDPVEDNFFNFILKDPLYLIKIENNYYHNSKKIYFENKNNLYYREHKILQIDKNNYILCFLARDEENKKIFFLIKKIIFFNESNYKSEEYNIYVPDTYVKGSRKYSFDFNLDINGNGFLILKSFDFNYIAKKIENFKDVGDLENLSKNIFITYNSLDNLGNGFILEYKADVYNIFSIYKHNLKNYEIEKEYVTVFEDINGIYENIYGSYISRIWSTKSNSIYMDKNGNGVIFFEQKKNDNYSLVSVKINNFKMVKKTILENKNKNYYYHNSYVNNKGNGFLVTANKPSYDIQINRIKDYELEL